MSGRSRLSAALLGASALLWVVVVPAQAGLLGVARSKEIVIFLHSQRLGVSAGHLEQPAVAIVIDVDRRRVIHVHP